MSDNIRCQYDLCLVFFFQAEDGIRDLVRSRGLGDVYKRQNMNVGCRRQKRLICLPVTIFTKKLKLKVAMMHYLSLIHI